ncbi:MAG: hypothetical protein P8179_07075 [Candidatus Thiodiazotropha sp.]
MKWKSLTDITNFFKVYWHYTIIFLGFIILCFFQGCGNDSKDREETPSATEPESPEITMSISGLFVKRYTISDSESNDVHSHDIIVWRKGMLNPWQMDQLYDQIVQLGFWEWDNEQIRLEISNIQEPINDVSGFSLRIQLKDKEKSFFAEGIYSYYEYRNIQSLENPVKAFDILSEIEATDEIYIPSEIELIVLSSNYGNYRDYEYLDNDENLSTVPWPYDDYPLDRLSSTDDSRFSVEGTLVASMVELMNSNMYFSYKGRNYIVRYHPVF